MRHNLSLFSFIILVLILNIVFITSFQQKQEIRSNAQTSSGIPQPTFACLGACPTSPPPLTTHIPGSQQPNVNDSAPTPCPQTQINAAYGDNTYEDDRTGKKKQKHKNNSGLLEILIKLLEILLQLVGGGTPPPSGGTPPSSGDKPLPSEEPCDPPEPTDEPEPTNGPEPTEAPEPTDEPVATQAPIGGGDAAVCGKKTTPPASTQTVSCTGLTATQPTSNGYYESTNFGCNIGFPKDPQDNCLPACSGTPECAGLNGRQCEEKVIWYSANADQYGCNTKLKVTNPVNGKAVIVRALDRGPGCAIQRNRSVFDISQAAYKEIGVQKFVHVEKVPESTPLGPIPVCTQ